MTSRCLFIDTPGAYPASGLKSVVRVRRSDCDIADVPASCAHYRDRDRGGWFRRRAGVGVANRSCLIRDLRNHPGLCFDSGVMARVSEAAEQLKLLAENTQSPRLLMIVLEPDGGAHRSSIRRPILPDALRHVVELCEMGPDTLVADLR